MVPYSRVPQLGIAARRQVIVDAFAIHLPCPADERRMLPDGRSQCNEEEFFLDMCPLAYSLITINAP
jgi:hypothetical protein